MLIDFNQLSTDELRIRIDKIQIWLFDNITDSRYYDGEEALWKAQAILKWREKVEQHKENELMKVIMESVI